MSNSVKKYLGCVVTHEREKGYGFIGIGSITKDDGTAPDLATTNDVFIHRDDCADDLRVGMTVNFEVIPDHKRGDGYFRAQGAVKVVEAEFITDDDPLVRHFSALQRVTTHTSGSESTDALANQLPPHPWQWRMKRVSPDAVAQTARNTPLPDASREEDGVINSSDPRVIAALEGFLQHEFPQMAGLDLGYNVVNVDEAEFDRRASEAAAELRQLGMDAQATLVEEEVKRFRGTRQALMYLREHNLIRRNTFISLRHLPDIFTAVPVWYFAGNEEDQLLADDAKDATSHPDPKNHPRTIAICDLFPENLRWMDTFQMFNRRMRTITSYKGDVIPVPIVRLLREVRQRFDHVVIATPYHDVAGADWGNLEWIRSIDPYVLGFQKGCSHFFILGRFSDSGVFPLYDALVADTIGFLRGNKEKLAGFDTATNPYWYLGRSSGDCHDQRYDHPDWFSGRNPRLGAYLIAHTEELLRAFDAGHLFDWLRGEWNVPDETALTPPA